MEIPKNALNLPTPDAYADRFFFYEQDGMLRLVFGAVQPDGTVHYQTAIRCPSSMIVDIADVTETMRQKIAEGKNP